MPPITAPDITARSERFQIDEERRLRLQRVLGVEQPDERVAGGLLNRREQRGIDAVVAVEHERRARDTGRVRADREARTHAGLARVQAHIELHPVDEVVGRAVVGETDGLGVICAHGASRWQGPGLPFMTRAPGRANAAMGTGEGASAKCRLQSPVPFGNKRRSRPSRGPRELGA